ncbi:hypothetical protein NDU88_003724 [Pleurodeles waltl]|uniref:Uncharacterized protein n=1 Tax=Pleurodeles waltl TaxID=8319 RepID=A0AAV7VI78_PLEWA|nr:hypothetical protein NDU88_003724 [Pleurodeles waltl]
MAYYTEEDEYYQDQPEATDEHQMEERLVEALGYYVQDSVNQVLIKALKPFTQPLVRFGQSELRGCSLLDSGSQQDQPSDVGFARGSSKGPKSSADILVHMAASVIKDHGYGSFSSLEVPEIGLDSSILTEGVPSSASHSSGSDLDRDEPKLPGKRKRKSHNIQESGSASRTLSFDPESIVHPAQLNGSHVQR